MSNLATDAGEPSALKALKGLTLHSLITQDGELQLSLAETVTPAPAADEVVVRMEAAPLNPSDMGLLFGPADLTTLKAGGTAERPSVSATIPPAAMAALSLRIGKPLTVGNEGAGVVVASGSDAREWMGRAVSVAGGGMYTQYRVMKKADCMVLDEGVTPAEGAAAFVNPLTALGMIGTMRREGHHALVHTAAASNLGQMLVKLCRSEGIELVNVVRSAAQMETLRGLGAVHVVDSSTPHFEAELEEAIARTGATLCFDALSGGPVPGQILTCMERALNRGNTTFSRYGSTTYKQLYMYGSLNTAPIQLPRVGMSWGVGGWLLFHFLHEIGPDAARELRERVNAEIRGIFQSRYKAEISLVEALSPAVIAEYASRGTGAKYLINPAKNAK